MSYPDRMVPPTPDRKRITNVTTTEPVDLTPAEGKLAQAYVEAMDIVGRCAQALADGDWPYLSDKAGQLRMRVEAFEEAADEAALQTSSRPREAVVLAEVAKRGGSYRAVALLHPDTGRRLADATESEGR